MSIITGPYRQVAACWRVFRAYRGRGSAATLLLTSMWFSGDISRLRQ